MREKMRAEREKNTSLDITRIARETIYARRSETKDLSRGIPSNDVNEREDADTFTTTP